VVCANVSGLMLARGTSRRREVAIRFAVGASRRRVLRQLITESVLVSAIGSAAAIAVLWILTVIGRDVALRADTPFTIEPRLGTPAVWFGVALAVAVGIAAGLMPALRATDRGRLLTPSSTMSLGATARRRWTLRDGLIVIQTAAAFVLLVTAGLLARSMEADILVLPTGVEKVALDFGKPTQRWLDRMTLAEARQHQADNQFDPGSMGPKIAALVDFVGGGGRMGLITNPPNLSRALRGETGTRLIAK